MIERIQAAIQAKKRERMAASEGGHKLPPEIEEGGLVEPYMPQAEGTELTLWQQDLPKFNKVYNDSITREWIEIDPAEDYGKEN